MPSSNAHRDERTVALDKARKALAIARDQAGRPEGQTAQAVCARLCARWGVTEAELEDGVRSESFDLGMDAPWVAYLLATVAEHYDCATTRQGRTARVFGEPDAIREAIAGFRYLRRCLVQAHEAWTVEVAQGGLDPDWAEDHASDYYLTGIATLRRRLRRYKNGAETFWTATLDLFGFLLDDEDLDVLEPADDDAPRITSEQGSHAEAAARRRPSAGVLEYEPMEEAERDAYRIDWPPGLPEDPSTR